MGQSNIVPGGGKLLEAAAVAGGPTRLPWKIKFPAHTLRRSDASTASPHHTFRNAPLLAASDGSETAFLLTKAIISCRSPREVSELVSPLVASMDAVCLSAALNRYADLAVVKKGQYGQYALSQVEVSS